MCSSDLLSSDPLLEVLCPQMEKIKLGDMEVEEVEKAVKPLLENTEIFGVNLYEVGMADKVCGYLKELTEGVGAVRRALEKYLVEK